MQLNIEPKPRGRRTVSQGFSLRPEVVARIKELAEAYETTMSDVVTTAVMSVELPRAKKKRNRK